MSVHPNDIWRELDYLKTELERCQAKVADLRRMLAALTLPKPAAGDVCPLCNLEISGRNQGSLTDHMRNVHGR